MTSAISRTLYASSSSGNTRSIDVSRKKLDETIQEQTSGIKYRELSEMSRAGVLTEYTSCIETAHKLDMYETQNIRTNSILANQTSILQKFREIATEIGSKVNEMSAVTDGIDMKMISEQYLRNIGSVLNSNTSGRYLFGGESNTAPIPDIEKFVSESSFVEGKPTSNYTQIIPSDKLISISPEQKIKIDINSDDIAFQEIIAAIHLAGEITGSSDSSKKLEIESLLDSARKNIDSLIAKVGYNEKILLSATESISSNQALISEQITEGYSISPQDLFAKLSENEGAIKASMAAVGKLFSMPSLADYLR